MQLFVPIIAATPGMLTGVVSVVAAMVISFVAIVLISSYYRFQHIVQQAEDTEPEEMGVSTSDVLRVQLARFVTGCNRKGSSFSLALIRISSHAAKIRMDSPVMAALKTAARLEDVACVFDDKTAALITENEPDDSAGIITRIIGRITAECDGVAIDQLRAGIASFPGHGSNGNSLVDVAMEALSETDKTCPVILPEINEPREGEEEADAGEEQNAVGDESVDDANDANETNEDEGLESEDESGEEASQSWAERRKTAMLDELTGVLKPSAVSSYMQRMMNDIRHKRKKAALFCVGVNNLDHMERFHGEQAVEDILVGISKILQDNVRATDLIGRHEKYAFLILAQVSLADAETIGRRISTIVQQAEFQSGVKKLKTTVTLGVAAYPEHGRNLHLLYVAGQKVLDYNRQNDIRAYAVYEPAIHDIIPSKPMKTIKSMKG